MKTFGSYLNCWQIKLNEEEKDQNTYERGGGEGREGNGISIDSSSAGGGHRIAGLLAVVKVTAVKIVMI